MFSKCSCRHCGGHIEFDAAHQGSEAACPHCGNQTLLSLSAPPLLKEQPQQFLLTIGDIGVTSNQVVTPNGSGVLVGSQWIFTDAPRTDTKIPAVAIILAIVFAFLCLIGLLFLLVKEKTTTGFVEVTVRTGNIFHKTQIPVSNQAKIDEIRQLVNKAQSIAMKAA